MSWISSDLEYHYWNIGSKDLLTSILISCLIRTCQSLHECYAWCLTAHNCSTKDSVVLNSCLYLSVATQQLWTAPLQSVDIGANRWYVTLNLLYWLFTLHCTMGCNAPKCYVLQAIAHASGMQCPRLYEQLAMHVPCFYFSNPLSVDWVNCLSVLAQLWLTLLVNTWQP